MNSIRKLFTPIQIGAIQLSHRIVMPPLTRVRSEQPGDIPGALMAEYYTQRASEGGLIITEAASVAIGGRAYYGAPGFYADAQVEGWKRIVDAVHAKGGKIMGQLWHGGRVAHLDLTEGQTPVAPSEVPFNGQALTKTGLATASPARALKLEEIPGIIEAFRAAAKRAKAAGFDGVELHGANGYLLDQFLLDGSNKRTDAYGEPVQNRARLLLEVVEAVSSVWGSDRVGLRISPSSNFNEMSDTNPQATYGYVANELNHFGLAYLHVIEPRVSGSTLVGENLKPVASEALRKIFTGKIIAAGGFEPDTAAAIIEKGDADLVAFGRHFIANPDLPKRLRLGLPLNPYDRSTFYGRAARGYTDYPVYQESAAAA
jgi:N-ethylmaleimide reductase